MADGFRNLAKAAQIFDESLKTVFVGMVPCSDVGELEYGLEKWEKVISSKIDEVKLFNSKAILVNASLQKGSLPNMDVDSNTAHESLGKSLDCRLRWGRALQAQAISDSLQYVTQQSPESALVVKELLSKLLGQQRYLDKLEHLERERERELSIATEDWQKAALDFAQRRQTHLSKNKAREEVDKDLEPLLAKMEVMRLITSRLMVGSQTYDWARDPAGLVQLLPGIRKEMYTPETFL